jgi:hypothetical protein
MRSYDSDADHADADSNTDQVLVEDCRMATRPRSGTSRTAKSPISGATGADTPTADVTGSALERREIPSFSESREARIAEAAYWRAEKRGFEAGHELDDWLAAERQIDAEGARRAPVRP